MTTNGMTAAETTGVGMAIAEAAELLKLMGNANRLAILCRLSEAETSVGEMEEALGIRQPTLSQQLGELRKAGLITDRRVAKAVYYRLADGKTRTLLACLHALFCDSAGDGSAALQPPVAPPAARQGAARAVRPSPIVQPTGRFAPDAPAAVFARILGPTDQP